MLYSQEHIAKHFETEVTSIFCELFRQDRKAPNFHVALISAIVRSFHIRSTKLSKLEKAKLILEQLFLCLPSSSFSLRDYLERHLLKKAEVKHLLITLLYGLYYGDIDLSIYEGPNQNELLECLMIQIVATKSPLLLRKIVARLSLYKKLVLLCFAHVHYREGSYFIFQALVESVQNERVLGDRLLATLISGLRSNYFDVKLFSELLKAQEEVDDSLLSDMLSKLSAHAQKETEEVYHLFNELIPLMLTFPERLFEEVEKLKAAGTFEPGMFCITQKEVELQKEHLSRTFKSFFANNYTLQDFGEFVKFFGLKAYPPLLVSTLQENDALLEKLRILVQLFSNSSRLMRINPSNAHQFFSFIIAIILHLDATIKNPSKYKEGLDFLSITIATKGKKLANTPTLLTLVQGDILHAEFLQKKLVAERCEYPIFVFDQSDEKIFLQNRKYIKKLNRLYKSAIIHISQKDALVLAEKIKAEPLLNTTQAGSFGYGGARNCVFLLAGLLHAAYKNGKKTQAELVEMDASEARTFFSSFVLGDEPLAKSGEAIFMVDDDMEIPAANIFTGALFAKEFQGDYVDASGYQLGRSTKLHLRFKNVNEILENPESVFLFTRWLDCPTNTGLSEHISKPKICLNIPNGNEEKHVRLAGKGHFFLQLSTHLGGSRFPNQEIPTRAFVGLDESLEKFIPYVFLIGLSTSLIDPINIAGRSILPWNDRVPPQMFSCLRNVFNFIAEDRTKHELQRRFWKNCFEFFHLKQTMDNEFMLDVRKLIDFDIDGYLEKYQEEVLLDKEEKASLRKIEKLYKHFQQDASLFWQFGVDLIENISKYVNTLGFSPSVFSEDGLNLPSGKVIDLEGVIEEAKEKIEKEQQKPLSAFPLTENMYLMSLALGNGNFCKIVKTCLENN